MFRPLFKALCVAVTLAACAQLQGLDAYEKVACLDDCFDAGDRDTGGGGRDGGGGPTDASPSLDAPVADASTDGAVTDGAVPKKCTVDADCERSLCSALPAFLGTCHPAKSCFELKLAVPASPSGVYTVDPNAGADAAAPFQAYCDMTSDGGGWTLAVKADGTKTTFGFSADLWTNEALLNAASPDLDVNEAKLGTFTTIPFTAIRVAIVDAAVTRSLIVPVASSSLRALFLAGPVTTTLGRAAWEGLLATPSLQLNCNAEGVNVQPVPLVLDSPAVRLGIVANQEDDCTSPDSWIGIGGFGGPCGPPPITTSVGNIGGCTPDGGDRNTAAFGYVMVR